MKTNILLFLLMIVSSMAFSQGGEFRILPEGGLSLPVGDFKSQNVFAAQGIQVGINLDKFWGKLGLGLYGGINSNSVNYEDGLPSVSSLISSRSSIISQDTWKQLLVGLGPIFKYELTDKLDLELSSKFGFSNISFPDYAEYVELGGSLNQEYLMYETRNEDGKDNLNAMLMSAARLSFKPSNSISISLGANYTHVKGVQHSYTYLNGGFHPGMTNDELEAAFRTSPTNTEVWKCDFNSVGVTLGIGFLFGGGNNKPMEDPKEDLSMEPPIPQYPEDGATITVEEADSLVLEWAKETPNVEKANYNLWLYAVRDSSRMEDSLLLRTKVERNQTFELPDEIKLQSGRAFRWQVQAIDDPQLKRCPVGCYSLNATFNVANHLLLQFYHLGDRDAGNYIQVHNQVRIVLPPHLSLGGKVNGRILNSLGAEVMSFQGLALGQQTTNYSIDNFGKLKLSISTLTKGYYVLEIFNERNERFYFRFIK